MRSAVEFCTVPVGEDYLLEQFLKRSGSFTPRNSLTHKSFRMLTLSFSNINKQRKKQKTKNTIINGLHVLVNKYFKVTIKLIGTEEGPHLWPKHLPSVFFMCFIT